MQEVLTHCKTATTNTLVLFDIDMVLIHPSDPAFQMPTILQHRHLAQKVFDSLPEEELDCLFTLAAMSHKPMLLDATVLKCFEHLKEHKIPTLALTANITGKLGDISSAEQHKIDQLHSLGLAFAPLAPFEKELIFTDLPSYRGYRSLYKQGCLFTNGRKCSKGEVLVTFLKHTKLSFEKVLFIDDLENNLKSVEEALAKHYPNTQFQGIHYLQARQVTSSPVDANSFEKKWQALAQKTREIRELEIATEPSCMREGRCT